MNTRLSRPRADRIRFGTVIRSAAPIMKGAEPIASRGNAVTPSRTTNSRIPAMIDAMGAATMAIVVKARKSGVVAPNPMTITTSESENSVADQPLTTKKARGYQEVDGCPDAGFGCDAMRAIKGRTPCLRRALAGG